MITTEKRQVEAAVTVWTCDLCATKHDGHTYRRWSHSELWGATFYMEMCDDCYYEFLKKRGEYDKCNQAVVGRMRQL